MLVGSDPTSTEGPEAPEGFVLPPLGTVIDARYQITRSIGAGGMGAVFEARQLTVGRRCALKFLRTELVGRSRSAARFCREARLLGTLEHEHLTAVLDYGAYLGKSPFLVMEYLEGCTLKQVFERQAPLPLDLALEILLQVARGMAYVHSQKVVHRDLKPANLMLTERSDQRPWLKILDFGIARALQEMGGQLTPSGAELGTAHYMSPEQARGTKEVDPRSDVYALGAILYEALTGVRVHPGDSYNAVIFHLLTQTHRPLMELSPACPAAVHAIVERCLEREPERRYADAGELARELAQLRRPEEAAPSVRGSSRGVPSGVGGRSARVKWLVGGVALGAGMTVGVGALTVRDGAARADGRAASVFDAVAPASGVRTTSTRASLLTPEMGPAAGPSTAAAPSGADLRQPPSDPLPRFQAGVGAAVTRSPLRWTGSSGAKLPADPVRRSAPPALATSADTPAPALLGTTQRFSTRSSEPRSDASSGAPTPAPAIEVRSTAPDDSFRFVTSNPYEGK